RAHLDQYARLRLAPADFEPILDLDAELDLDQVTPDLFQALQRLQPFGQGNPEPIFSASAVRLMAPPKILKDKHVKLKLAAALTPPSNPSAEQMTEVAILTTPRCHPDGGGIRRSERRSATENRELGTENSNWRRNIAFDALGWHMAERLQAAKFLAGDTLDIAFTIGHNDHPAYGGLELSLRDFHLRS
ncbi:MAG: hypothetical protein WA628_21525, partial [Terriglobales bacterium]